MGKRHWIRRDLRLAIYERDEWRCAYCGRELEDATATLDHINPRKNGGTNDPYNLVTACHSCNEAKGSRSAREFAPERMKHIMRLQRRGVKRRRREIQRRLLEEQIRDEIEAQVRAEYRARYGEDDTDVPF